MGIGLAIPINMAKEIYQQLIDTGKVVRGFLGVVPQDFTPDMAESFELEKGTRGVILPEITPDSAADKAGLKAGDIVIKFDGKDVTDADQFRRIVAIVKPGTKVDMLVIRGGKRKTITVELAERPATAGKEKPGSDEPTKAEQLGLSVENLTDDIAEKLGYTDQSGVIVTKVEPGSPAHSKGIGQGHLIQQVNRETVKNVKQFNKAVEKIEPGQKILLLVRSGAYPQYVVLTMPEKE